MRSSLVSRLQLPELKPGALIDSSNQRNNHRAIGAGKLCFCVCVCVAMELMYVIIGATGGQCRVLNEALGSGDKVTSRERHTL